MLLIKWICAHMVGDFLLQSRKMVLHKQRLKAASWMLYLHAIIHGLLIYLVSAHWSQWKIPLAIAVLHFLIDWWKISRKPSKWLFLTDQVLHILSLTVVWFFTIADIDQLKTFLASFWNNQKYWLYLGGYLLLMWPLSMVIGIATQQWRQEVNRNFENQQTSLAEAGKWIGILERLMVYTFILTQQFAGIGFLITAKSILRFNETHKGNGRKEAEYILIGTLMSFSLAIITGLFVKWLANHM